MANTKGKLNKWVLLKVLVYIKEGDTYRDIQKKTNLSMDSVLKAIYLMKKHNLIEKKGFSKLKFKSFMITFQKFKKEFQIVAKDKLTDKQFYILICLLTQTKSKHIHNVDTTLKYKYLKLLEEIGYVKKNTSKKEYDYFLTQKGVLGAKAYTLLSLFDTHKKV
jgi:hypothetical protein